MPRLIQHSMPRARHNGVLLTFRTKATLVCQSWCLKQRRKCQARQHQRTCPCLSPQLCPPDLASQHALRPAPRIHRSLGVVATHALYSVRMPAICHLQLRNMCLWRTQIPQPTRYQPRKQALVCPRAWHCANLTVHRRRRTAAHYAMRCARQA